MRKWLIILSFMFVILTGCVSHRSWDSRDELIKDFEQDEDCVRWEDFAVFLVSGETAAKLFAEHKALVLIDFANRMIFILDLGKGGRT